MLVRSATAAPQGEPAKQKHCRRIRLSFTLLQYHSTPLTLNSYHLAPALRYLGSMRHGKVLFLNHTGAVSGAEISLITLATALRKRGFDVMVAATEDGPLRSLCERRLVPFITADVEPVQLARPGAVVRTTLKLHHLLRIHRPTIVHANSFHAMKMMAPLASLTRLPLVCSIRDIVPFTWLTRVAISKAEAVVCISHATAENLLRGFPKKRRQRIRVIYNGVEVERFVNAAPAPDVVELSDHLRYPVIACISPLVRWKGQTVLLQSLRYLGDWIDTVRVVIVGHDYFSEPGYVEELHTLAQHPLLAGKVHFLGFRDNVAQILAASSIVVVPSLEPDAITRVAVEAMAAGKAVVASRIGGIPEAVDHEQTGLLVPPGDPVALARALRRLLDHPELRARLGKAGARAAQRFSVEYHVQEMTSLYREVGDRFRKQRHT